MSGSSLLQSLTGGLLGSGKAEADFVDLLNAEINKFNDFFMEQEEDFIIRHKDLQEKIQSAIATLGPNGSQPSEVDYKEETGSIRKDIVNFHGEMVVLENYSNINYIGEDSNVGGMAGDTDGVLKGDDEALGELGVTQVPNIVMKAMVLVMMKGFVLYLSRF